MKIKNTISNKGKLANNTQLFFMVLSLVLLMSSSCLTSSLWKDHYKYYDDTINQYLITKDGERVIFLGKKYHYILNDKDNVIKELLNWPSRKKMTMSIYNFNAISKDKVEVSIKVSVDSKKQLDELSQSELTFLKSLGFKTSKFDSYKIFHLNGQRYLPKPNTSYGFNSSLNKNYNVKVGIKYNSATDIAGNIALTPITVVGDVVLVAGVTAIIAVAIPVCLIYC
jgi:hypothetical protein